MYISKIPKNEVLNSGDAVMKMSEECESSDLSMPKIEVSKDNIFVNSHQNKENSNQDKNIGGNMWSNLIPRANWWKWCLLCVPAFLYDYQMSDTGVAFVNQNIYISIICIG